MTVRPLKQSVISVWRLISNGSLCDVYFKISTAPRLIKTKCFCDIFLSDTKPLNPGSRTFPQRFRVKCFLEPWIIFLNETIYLSCTSPAPPLTSAELSNNKNTMWRTFTWTARPDTLRPVGLLYCVAVNFFIMMACAVIPVIDAWVTVRTKNMMYFLWNSRFVTMPVMAVSVCLSVYHLSAAECVEPICPSKHIL